MTSLKAIFIFTLIWCTFTYLELRRSKLGTPKNPIKLWVVAKKEKAVYFKARQLVSALKKKTGLHYEWKVVFSKEKAMNSLRGLETDVIIDFAPKRNGPVNEFDRGPAAAKGNIYQTVKGVKFRNYLPQRITFDILKGLERKRPNLP
ncbi:hypothetical protein OAK75_09330 [Bacteriovoracales bacterium]|nr:hypothetical protein [Bacteriovoracales bacterium]